MAMGSGFSPVIKNGLSVNLIDNLEAGISASMITLTDSTGASTNTWPFYLLSLLAASFTQHDVKYYVWNAGLQAYNTPVYLRGADGGRYIQCSTTGVNAGHADITSIAGDIDVRVKVRSTNYASGSTQALVGKYTATNGTKGWRLAITSTGQLQFLWSIDGTAQITTTSTVTLPSVGIVNDTDIYLRATLDVDNGSSGNTVTYYYSTTGTTWTPLGAPVITATATSIYILNTTQKWEAGVTGTTANVFSGRLYNIEIRDGINGFVVSPLSIDSWIRYTSGVSFVGNPLLTMVIGGHSGADINYLQDATRIKTMIPYDSYSCILVSCGHNDGLVHSYSYKLLWNSYIAAIRGRIKTGDISIVTQNPQKSPATSYDAQAKRMGQLISIAYENNCLVFPMHKYFIRLANWQAMINDADGIHPVQAGYQFMAASIYNQLMGVIN